MSLLLSSGIRGRLLTGTVSLALLLALLNPTAPAVAQQSCSPPPIDDPATLADAQRLLTQWYRDRGLTLPRFQVVPGIPATVPSDQVFVVEKKMLACGGVDATDYPVIDLAVGTHVPDLSGLNRRDAEAAIANAGFTATPNPPDAPDDWLVQGQTPEAGTLLVFTQEVAFTLEQYQIPPSEVQVPGLLNLTEDDARSAVADAQLVLEVLGATGEPPRYVVDQDPPAGATAHPGDPVRVHLRGSVTTGGGSPPTGPSGGGLSGPPPGTLVTSPTNSSGGLLFAFLLLFLLLAIVLAAVHRRQRVTARRASPGQVRAVAHHDPNPLTATRLVGSKPGLAIRLQPHGDAGRQASISRKAPR